uniref:FecR family protein n=1 Tax=Phenylobacterium sp. TaxID=1871053 RepID=UPI00286A2483
MTKSLDNESVRQAAIDWFVRLQGEASLADWTDFRTWLEADRAHAEAYDAVETIWVEVESPSVARPAEARPATGVVVPFRARIDRRSLWLGAAAAAAVAAAVVTSQLTAPPPAVLYTTGPGQTRVVTLAEGSRLTLGAGTRIEVRLSPARRDVELAEGEASFDVTHRPDRPFIVTVGARQVRVLGTEFNIFHRAGDLVVTVRRGLVSVAEHDRDQ